MKLAEATKFLISLHIPSGLLNDAPVVTFKRSEAWELANDMAAGGWVLDPKTPEQIMDGMTSDKMITMLCGCRIKAAAPDEDQK